MEMKREGQNLLRLALSIFLLFGLLHFWPSTTADEEAAAAFTASSESSQASDLLFTTTTEIFNEEEIPPSKPKASCDVFDPFKVLPATDSGHFQIGGPFPLHKEDCLELRPSSVQDVVAVQWAMAYWNEQKKAAKEDSDDEEDENEDNKRRPVQNRPKLGLFAGDSCTRSKEAIAQSLRFLDNIGFMEPTECLISGGLKTPAAFRRKSGAPNLIGVLAPKDRESAEAVAQSLHPSSLPIGVYSPAAAQAFLDTNVQGFITTAPLFGDYFRTLLELLKMLGSNLVSIVDYGGDFPPTQKLKEQLRQNGISIAEVVGLDHSLLASTLSQSDTQIIVSLVSNFDLTEAGLGHNQAIRNMPKLWITMELEMGGNDEEDGTSRLDFLANGGQKGGSIKLQTITIRRQQRYLADFNAYFLRVLMTNYEHYSLLNSYVQFVYNCSQGPAKFPGKKPKALCSPEQLEPKRLAKLHRQSSSTEAAIFLVYAFARTAEHVEADEGLRQKCGTPNVACFDGIRQELLKMESPLNENQLGRLPPGFSEQLTRMRFFLTPEGAIQMAGIGIEAILKEKEGREEGGSVYKLLEYRTGLNENGDPIGNIQKFQLPTKLRHIRSRCPPYRSFCADQCRLATRRPDDQTFLSIPQHFSLYLAGMFDFQSGTNCDRLRRDNPAAVALPLAFVHSMSTFRQRNGPKSALFNAGDTMDIGTLLVDTCSNARTLMEFLVDSERNCYKFTQVERNWTIASSATIGYVFGSDELGPAQSGVLQAMFAGPSSTPIVSFGKEKEEEKEEQRQPGGGNSEDEGDDHHLGGGMFTDGPTHGAMAMALAKFLRQMHWSYVNVVLDRSDPTSVSIFKQFERLSSSMGICAADLTIIGDERENGRDGEGPKIKRSSATSNKRGGGNGREHVGAGMVAVTSANVTLVFSAVKQAAEYMSARLRDEFMAAGTSTNVHVVIGDAHDFHLHDPTNLAQYAGTVSFQAKDVTQPEFQDWIRSITPLTLPEVWYWRHVEENWHCALSRSNIARFHGRMCSGEELLDVNGMGRLTKAGYLARGIDRLLMAIDRAHTKLCPNEKLCDEFIKDGRKLIREMLSKMASEDEDAFEVFQLIPTEHGGKFEYKLFANHSIPHSSSIVKKEASKKFHLIADYRPFAGANGVNGDVEELKPIVSRCRPPFCKCPSSRNEFGFDDSAGKAAASYIRREPARKDAENSEELLLVYENSADDPEVQELSGVLERELNDTLRIVFLVLSALLCALAVATLLLILIKMYQRKIKGHQSLGILLLLGICALFSTAFLFANAPTSELICHLRIGLHAFGHTLCFGVVIVKAIQLRNAETLALMGASAQQISYWNYWLLLVFIVAVQLVICLKWLLLEPFGWATNKYADNNQSPQLMATTPSVDNRILLCSYSSPNFVLAQIYTFLLLLLALLLSAQNRSIKRNYREAKWLFLTSLTCTLLLCAWALCHILVNPIYLDHMTVLELHLTGSLLLAFIFGPKLYVLLFYEPIVVECVYGGSVNGPRGDKNVDLFEADWNRDNNAFSPTLSNRSSNANCQGGGQQIGEDDDERVTSAFQTVLRKKTGGSGSKMGSQSESRTTGSTMQSNKNGNNSNNILCSKSTPKIGQRGKTRREGRPMSPQNR